MGLPGSDRDSFAASGAFALDFVEDRGAGACGCWSGEDTEVEGAPCESASKFSGCG